MKAQRAIGNRRHAYGLAAVELALLLPVFAFLMTATFEVGRALYQFNTLTKAVRDSAQYLARYGVVAGVLNPTPAEVTTARNLVVYGTPVTGGTTLLPGMDPNDVKFLYQAIAPSLTNNYVTVRATYPFKIDMFGMVLYDGILQSRTVERVE